MKCYYSSITSYDQLMQSQSDKRGKDPPKSLQTEYPNTPFLFQRGRAGSKAHFTLTLYISIENLKKKGSKLVLVELFYACSFHWDFKPTPFYFPRLNYKISSSQWWYEANERCLLWKGYLVWKDIPFRTKLFPPSIHVSNLFFFSFGAWHLFLTPKHHHGPCKGQTFEFPFPFHLGSAFHMLFLYQSFYVCICRMCKLLTIWTYFLLYRKL